MAHKEQQQFCEYVKEKFPCRFRHTTVLDVGSLDINGNNRYLFEDCDYLGIDLSYGSNVDIVCPVHEFISPESYFDVVISTECFEHDKHYVKSLKKIVNILKEGGLFLFTCATIGRKEHGIESKRPGDSPFTTDYYKNLTYLDIEKAIPISEIFSDYRFSINASTSTLGFWGIKREICDIRA